MLNAIFLADPMLQFLVIVVLILLVTSYVMYVSLVKKKNKVKEAFAGIDVQLKKRYDLIPNVLFIANKYMEHERTLLEEITKLRAEAVKVPADLSKAKETINLDGLISGKMGQLMVAVENYPQLKADQPMMQAMQTYSEQEEHIAAARRFYNSAVLELNNAVEIFPSSMIAGMMNLTVMPFFEATETERQAVDASKYFNK